MDCFARLPWRTCGNDLLCSKLLFAQESYHLNEPGLDHSCRGLLRSKPNERCFQPNKKYACYTHCYTPAAVEEHPLPYTIAIHDCARRVAVEAELGPDRLTVKQERHGG